MSRRTAVLMVLLAATIVLAMIVTLGSDPPESHDEHHVLVISIDGLPASMFHDPRAPIPTLRALAAEGIVAQQGMRVSDPTVTWPTHASLVTGTHPDVHGVLANGSLVGGSGPRDPVRVDVDRDEAELIDATTIYDAASDAGLSTAGVYWGVIGFRR